MNKQDFTTSFTVDQSPEEVFKAINNVRGWWSGEVDGNTDSLGAEFTYRYQNMHKSTQKVTEFVPNKKVVWQVVDSELTFVKDKKEWIGTMADQRISWHGGSLEKDFQGTGQVILWLGSLADRQTVPSGPMDFSGESNTARIQKMKLCRLININPTNFLEARSWAQRESRKSRGCL